MSGKLILVTGGAGYIGSHTTLELLNAGYDVVVVDNLCNSSRESIIRVENITRKKVPFHEVDLLDKDALSKVFDQYNFDAVVHFAGLKAVGESVKKPVMYYHNNITGTVILIEVMSEHSVYNIVFSSSATVYGIPQYLPFDEKHPVGNCTNPYGKTKQFIEEILKDQCTAEPEWNAILLRYFNPVGAHKSGSIGEDPLGIPNNLMPYVSQVAVGKRPHLNVFGDDYDTPDGTGVRDYIHVVDLALGHVAALKKFDEKCACKVYNLGAGKGHSVLQLVDAFEKASGKKLPYKIIGRRAGDLPAFYADASLAAKELGWTAERGLTEMCEDTWRWQSANPNGFSQLEMNGKH